MTAAWMLTVMWCVTTPTGDQCAAKVIPAWLPSRALCADMKAPMLDRLREEATGLIWAKAVCSEVARGDA